MKYDIGIDPGLSGGIALVSESCQAQCWPMPATEGDLRDLICGELGHLINPDRLRGVHGVDIRAFVENVNFHFPHVRSAAKLYGSFMAVRQALVDHGIGFDLVTPGKWQRSFGLTRKKTETPTKWKNRLKAKAQQLFPQLGRSVTLKTADALLIAEYGRRQAR